MKTYCKISEFLKSPPRLAKIPNYISSDQLSVRHPGYDIRAAQQDPNVVFPHDILKNLHKENVFGSYTDNFYSFVGASQQSAIIKTHAPKWAQMLKSHNVDAVLLVAAWPVCHMSVGHVARIFELMGISTVCFFVKAFIHLVDQMKIPRTIITNN